MLISHTKKRLVTNSLLELGDVVQDEKNGKGRKFVSRFIEAGVAHYQDLGDVLITKETLDKFIHTMECCPVIIRHKEITEKNADRERIGVIADAYYNENDGWYYCSGVIWGKQAIDLVKNQGWNVSCTYDFVSDNQVKTHNGKKIDMEFIDGNFLHLALVPNPRYERANIVINSKEDEALLTVENESEQDLDDTSVDRWITIKPNGSEAKGRPLLIKAGKTVDEAIKDKFDEWARNNSKQQKLFDIKEYKKSKEEIKKEKAVKPIEPTSPSPKYPNQDRPQQEPKKQDKEKQGESEFERILRETKEKTNRKIEYEDEEKEERKVNIDGQQKTLTQMITEENYKPMKQGFQYVIYKGNQYYRIKPSEYDYLKHISRKKTYAEKPSKEFQILKSTEGGKIKYSLYRNGDLQSHSDDFYKVLKHKFELQGKLQAKNSTEIERKDNQFMDLFKDLEKFILNVVNNAEDEKKDDKKDEKVENEDKRKIIDEIGGILKGKVDEEVWRTIVGKLEKVAYNPSETDKADNKTKNEDEKEEEKEEKYEKEKEIADVENKCGKAKNSMDKAREIVFGGSQPEFKPSYVSREDRLKLGDNY